MGTTDEDVKAEVLAAANGLFAAIAADDEQVIDSLLGDDLYYFHSSGRFDLKPSYMASLRLRPTDMRFEDAEVRLYGGEAALIICSYVIDHSKDFDGTTPGPHVEARGIQAWTKRDGRWQLVAHQGTKEAKPN